MYHGHPDQDFDLDLELELMDIFGRNGLLAEPFVPYFDPDTPPKCQAYMADIIYDEYMPLPLMDPDHMFKEKCNDDFLDSGMEDAFDVPSHESILNHISDLLLTESQELEEPHPTPQDIVDMDHNYTPRREEIKTEDEIKKEEDPGLPCNPFETPPDTPEEYFVPVGRQKLRSSTKALETLNVRVNEALSAKKPVKRKQPASKNVEAPFPKYSRTSNKNSISKPANSQKRTKCGKAENPKKKTPKGRTDHSANERIRRDILKRAFTSLRERVPIQCMLTEKDKPTALISKQKILTGAIKYITGLMEEKREFKRSIRRIFKQCKVLRETHHKMYKKICKRHRH